MFNAGIINDADKLNEEVKRYKDIPIVSDVTKQQVMDNYFQVKVDIKKIILEETKKLIAEKENIENKI